MATEEPGDPCSFKGCTQRTPFRGVRDPYWVYVEVTYLKETLELVRSAIAACPDHGTEVYDTLLAMTNKGEL